MLIMPSFKKSLIVEQLQGNYLKWFNVVFNRSEITNPLPAQVMSMPLMGNSVFFLCCRYQTHEKKPKTSLISSAYFLFCISPQSRRANYPSWLRSQSHVHLSQQFVKKQARWPRFFFQVFAKNSLIKNIFEEEKKFDSRTLFFWGK